MTEGPRLSGPLLDRRRDRSEVVVRLAARKALGWPKRCKLAHAFLWEFSWKRLKLAQLLGQLGGFLACMIRDLKPERNWPDVNLWSGSRSRRNFCSWSSVDLPTPNVWPASAAQYAPSSTASVSSPSISVASEAVACVDIRGRSIIRH